MQVYIVRIHVFKSMSYRICGGKSFSDVFVKSYQYQFIVHILLMGWFG